MGISLRTWVGLFLFVPIIAFAKAEPESFQQYLLSSDKSEMPTGSAKASASPSLILRTKTSKFFMDDIRAARKKGETLQMIGRDIERDQAMDILVRLKGRTPLFLGPAGVGKTAIVQMMAEAIIDGKYPQTNVYLENFKNGEIIETTPALISSLAMSDDPASQALALETFMRAVQSVQEQYEKEFNVKKPITVFIDEFHTLTAPQIEALKRFQEDLTRPIRIIGASTSGEYEVIFKNNPAAKRRVEIVGVPEFTIDETKEVLRSSWVPYFEKRYNVTVSEEAIDTIIRVAPYLKPGLARPEAPFKVLQDLAVSTHRKAGGVKAEIKEKDIYDFAALKTRLPVNPHDASEFRDYISNLRNSLKKQIVGQDHVIDGLVDQWAEVLSGDPVKPGVVLLTFPVGADQSEILEKFSEIAFGSKGRTKIISGSNLRQGGFSLSSEFGGPPGVRAFEKTSGETIEFLQDPARGRFGGLLVVTNADQMHAEGHMRFGEFFDRGMFPSGDGKYIPANRHLVIYTTTKGSEEIFPSNIKNWADNEIKNRREKLSETELKRIFLQRNPDSREENELPQQLGTQIQRALIVSPMTKANQLELVRRSVEQYIQERQTDYQIQIQVDASVVEHLSASIVDISEGTKSIQRMVSENMGRALTAARSEWSMTRGDQIQIGVEHKEDGTSNFAIKSKDGKTIQTSAPKIRTVDPLQDPDRRRILENLSRIMHEEMVEQPEAVDAIVTAVNAQYGDPTRVRPIAITVIGTTGIGKTVLGKALGKALYGSDKRYSNIALGDKHTDRDLQRVFGSNPDSASHTKVWEFEQALMSNPQGGVIIFDEFSNMGGEDIEKKNALIKKFYDILEEGVWRSPRDGRVYQLSNYVFLFTGNDLEREFQGVTGDEQRVSIWKSLTRHPEKVHKHLVESGVPEAFLGRQDAVVLMRPLIAAAKARVTGRLLSEYVARVKETIPGIEIKWDEAFLQKFANAFYTHNRGARSVRSVIENQIAALITRSRMEMMNKGIELKGTVFTLSITDNVPTKSYSRTAVPKRLVEVAVSVENAGKIITQDKMDATQSAASVVTMNRTDARSVAIREAAQIVVNDFTITQEQFEYASIQAEITDGEPVLGYVRFSLDEGSSYQWSRKRVLARLARYYAGRIAQESAGYDIDSTWSTDLSQMREIASEYFEKYGLSDGLVAIRQNENGEMNLSPDQKRIFDTEMKALFDEAKAISQQLVTENRSFILRVSAELLRKGSVTSQDIEKLRKRFSKKSCGDLFRKGSE